MADEALSRQLFDALLTMDRIGAEGLLRHCADGQTSVLPVEGLISQALDTIGQGWERGDVSLAQVYMSARMAQELLGPYMPDSRAADTGGRALLVLEDQHLLGARIVRSVMACAGLAPADWGAMSTPDAIRRIKLERPSIVLVSTLMLRSALQVGKLTAAIRAEGLETRVIVGGAPFRFDPLLWSEVGADAMGTTSSDAVGLVKNLSSLFV